MPTRLLEHVFGLLDARALGTAARVDGRCHRVCESKTLWQALGVARWELAVRASVREQAGGFSVAPLLATYRPSSSSNKNKSTKQLSRPKSARQLSSSRPSPGEERGAGGVGAWVKPVAKMETVGGVVRSDEELEQAPVSPQRTALGLTMDVFLSDDEEDGFSFR